MLRMQSATDASTPTTQNTIVTIMNAGLIFISVHSYAESQCPENTILRRVSPELLYFA